MKYVVAVALVGLAASPALAQATLWLQPTPERPIIAITATESVRAEPDRATVGVGVQTVAPTASAALQQNSAKMERVIAALKARGIPARDIQTSGINLNADYAYEVRGQPPRFTGYRVSNTVRATTKDIAKLGALLDAMVTAGGNTIEGPFFTLDDNKAQLKEARDKALASPQARADEYGARTGLGRARLVSIVEGANFAQPMSEIMVTGGRAYGELASAVSAPPVQPGQLATGVTLTVYYQLER